MLMVINSRLSVFLLPLAILTWSAKSDAKSIKVTPASAHGSLTLSTDGSKGFVIFPKRPMKLDLVGPGQLKLVIRLNNTRKRKAFKGTLDINANNRRILRSALNLFMSRVGTYRENRSLHPSTPKTLTVNIPRGLQHLRISIRASRRTSMTISLNYRSKADQSAANYEDDQIALVPLVPPHAKTNSDDDLELVPLVPLVPHKTAEKPVRKKNRTSTTIAKISSKPKKNTTVNKGHSIASEEFELLAGQTKPTQINTKSKIEKKPRSHTKTKIFTPKHRQAVKVTNSDLNPEKRKRQNTVYAKAHAKTSPFLSIGLYGGEVSPFQAIGSSSATGSMDIRYILPVFEGRLGIGLGVSYHRFSASIGYDNSTTKADVSIDAIPVTLQLFYRIPLDTAIEPFVGAGVDMIIALAEVGYDYKSSTSAVSDTAVGFGGHLSVGAEAAIGPGFLLVEVRGGIGVVNLNVIKNLNPSGLSVLAGYRLEI